MQLKTGTIPHTLKLLRDLMNKKLPIELLLEKTVYIVATQLNVDVCSCYLIRPGDILELYASHGLDKSALHETFLQIGEGLIGEIALQRKSLIFEDTWSHPSFVHKPETKETNFKSMAGTPILKADHLYGVLAIQTTQIQTFPSEIIELLETIALALSEILARENTQNKQEPINNASPLKKLEGVNIISGVAVGTAFIHKRIERTSNILAKDASTEIKRLNDAFLMVQEEINNMLANPQLAEEQVDIFKSYLMFTKDKGWIEKITTAIQMGLTAEASVQKVSDEIAERMRLITDPYLRERIHDFNDLANRLIKNLKRKSRRSKLVLDKNTILIAENMGPAELLDYDIKKIKAIVLEEGSQTMHVAIVAKSLNIPMIGGIDSVLSHINTGDYLAVDATKGLVYINPSDEVLDSFSIKIQTHQKLLEKYKQLKGLPSVTLDGTPVQLNINIGLANDLMSIDQSDYDGVGLYRTELPFMTSNQLPDTETQTEIYKKAILQVGDKPLTFRTLDIGSDKVLPYFDNTGEKNPAMGWRSIRITLDRRALLRSQLRSFIRAINGKKLRIMFPMISDVDEFLEAKKTLEIELKREKSKGGVLPASIKVGTMLEVPSLIFQLPELLKHVDFVSVGTNDLYQFLFATDRGNPLIWNRYDSLAPATLKVLKYISDECKKANIPCSVCGEIASNPIDAIALIALGYTSLSMNPTAIPAIKAVVRTMNRTKTAEYIFSQIDQSNHSIREQLKSYAIDHGIFI